MRALCGYKSFESRFSDGNQPSSKMRARTENRCEDCSPSAFGFASCGAIEFNLGR